MKKTCDKKINQSISKSLFYIFVSFMVLVVSTWTWYVNNTKVGGEALEISASTSRFELVMKDEEGNEYSTTSPNTMDWVLSSSSNIGNNIANQESQPRGIEPGDYGSLTFYIKLKVDDIQQLSYSFDFMPCEETSKDDEEVQFIAKYGDKDLTLKEQTDARLSELLSGHILFFEERIKRDNDEGFYYKNLIDSKKISVDCSNSDSNNEIEVTIYWVWPLQVDYYISTGNPGDLFETEAEVTAMVEHMNDNQGMYFDNPQDSENPQDLDNEKPPLPTDLEVKKLSEMGENITRLRDYYNWGDQYIGENATFTKLSVTVQE